MDLTGTACDGHGKTTLLDDDNQCFTHRHN